MYAERHQVAIVTAADGSFTGYTPVLTGRVLGVRLDSVDLDSGIDITITGESTGIAILALTDQGGSDATYYPRHQVCGPTGTALTYDGTRTVNEPPLIVNERIKVLVAQGGNVKSGTLHLLVG